MGGVESRDARLKHKLQHAMAVGGDICFDANEPEIPVNLVTSEELKMLVLEILEDEQPAKEWEVFQKELVACVHEKWDDSVVKSAILQEFSTFILTLPTNRSKTRKAKDFTK